MQVNTGINGSHLVVFAEGAYIDARKDVRMPLCSKLELVIGGFVKRYKTVANTEAPEVITAWMRELKQLGY